MVTKAGFKGGVKKPASPSTPSAAKTATKEGKKPRMVVDPLAQLSRSMAGKTGDHAASDLGPKVDVMVPQAFKLTDDDHVVWAYSAGRQPMPRAHAEHYYAVANGVTIQE